MLGIVDHAHMVHTFINGLRVIRMLLTKYMTHNIIDARNLDHRIVDENNIKKRASFGR